MMSLAIRSAEMHIAKKSLISFISIRRGEAGEHINQHKNFIDSNKAFKNA